jgi:putative CocE/NonD family hydrolase
LQPEKKLGQDDSDDAIVSKESFKYDPDKPVPTVGGANLDTTEWKQDVLRKAGLKAGSLDQRSLVESRGDVILFSTSPLTEDLAVAGAPELKLFCSTDCADTDFAARLTDVFPDGRSMLVSDGIKRLSFRNSLSRPEEAKPGKVYELKIELEPTAITFRKGHRIRVIVSGSSYPRFDTCNNTFCYGLARLNPMMTKKVATNSVYMGKEFPSALNLPVVQSGLVPR